MHRFYISQSISGDAIVITQPELLGQLTRVLRLQAGDVCVVFDGSGYEYACEVLSFNKHEAHLLITKKSKGKRELDRNITLYQSLLKGDHFEVVLQKATELGVKRFVPIVSDRSIVRDISEQKQKRYRHILTEATEQCGGCIVPSLADLMTLSDALEASGAGALFCFEGESKQDILGAPAHKKETILFVGPEGGFTDDEVEHARESGAHVVSLGKRILRAETAAVVACALVAHA